MKLPQRKTRAAFIRKGLSGTRIISSGFILIILAGAVLLMLPASSADKTWTPPLTALFTSTTATCVTGLTVVDTYSHWSLFGQLVILLLIQIGGLGFMSMALLLSIALRKKISIRQRLLMGESISIDSLSGIVRLMKNVIALTFVFELAGAALLAVRFIPEFGVADGIYKSFFHSVSAFCNAGIDILPYSSSLAHYSSDALVLLTMSALVIIGGLGFAVWEDIWCFFRKKRHMRLHSKLVLSISAILLFGGTALYFVFEFKNPDTIGNMPFGVKLLLSFFQSVTTRTAGYSTFGLSALTNRSILLTLILMFIGGSPGSTAGGVKTTTVGLFFLIARSSVRGSSEIHVFGRKISKLQMLRAVTIIVISVSAVAVGTILICCTDNFPFTESLFETVSALGTVGISMDVTPNLSSAGKAVVILLMYLGRIGVITAIFSIAKRQNRYVDNISYPQETIII